MTNIKYSKRFKLRNGERVDFCPECDYHITDTVNNSDSVYCPKCGQQIQLFKPALCPKDCDFLKKHQYLGKFFVLPINIKRINSLNVLLIGYLKLFPQ